MAKHKHRLSSLYSVCCILRSIKSWHSATQNSNMIGLRASHKTHTKIQWDPPTASENLQHRPSRSSTPLVEISCLCRRAATRNDDNRQQWHPALPSLSPRLMASPAGLRTPCRLFSLRPFVSISSSMQTLNLGRGGKIEIGRDTVGGGKEADRAIGRFTPVWRRTRDSPTP